MQGKVFAHVYIFAWVEFGATLTNEDVSCLSILAAEQFYAEALTVTVPAVVGTTDAFLMCHD
jgi:hypothetical protein